jgi:hypothetical protein
MVVLVHVDIHTDVVTYLVYYRKLVEIGLVVETDAVSAYPSLDDLPTDGWVWYDEREGTDTTTESERASNA